MLPVAVGGNDDGDEADTLVVVVAMNRSAVWSISAVANVAYTSPEMWAVGYGVTAAGQKQSTWLRSRDHNFQLPSCNYNFRRNSVVIRSLYRYK